MGQNTIITLMKALHLERLFFIGDSYTGYMINSNSGILDVFSDVYFVRINDNQHIHAVNQYLKIADYIVYERIESCIPKILGELACIK